MIRRVIAVFAAISLAAPLLAAPPIAGRWLTADGTAIVAIDKCGATMCGRIAKVLKGVPAGRPQVDALNPDPNLQSRPLLGLPILIDLTPSDDGWTGKIYDPKTGKTYNAIVGRDGTNLKVQGCVLAFCRTMIWMRAG